MSESKRISRKRPSRTDVTDLLATVRRARLSKRRKRAEQKSVELNYPLVPYISTPQLTQPVYPNPYLGLPPFEYNYPVVPYGISGPLPPPPTRRPVQRRQVFVPPLPIPLFVPPPPPPSPPRALRRPPIGRQPHIPAAIRRGTSDCKVQTGPYGGKFIIRNGKKVYVPCRV